MPKRSALWRIPSESVTNKTHDFSTEKEEFCQKFPEVLFEKCLVEVVGGRFVDYSPPAGIERRSAISRQTVCRLYTVESGRAEDKGLGKAYTWNRDQTQHVLGSIIGERLQKNAMATLDE